MHEALSSVPGVRHVEIKFEAQEAIVTVDKGKSDPKAMYAALKNAGFGGELAH